MSTMSAARTHPHCHFPSIVARLPKHPHTLLVSHIQGNLLMMCVCQFSFGFNINRRLFFFLYFFRSFRILFFVTRVGRRLKLHFDVCKIYLKINNKLLHLMNVQFPWIRRNFFLLSIITDNFQFSSSCVPIPMAPGFLSACTCFGNTLTHFSIRENHSRRSI